MRTFSNPWFASIDVKMGSILRGTFNHLLVLGVVAGIWSYAHLRNVTEYNLGIVWREGNVVRNGNPYLAPLPRAIISAPDDPAAATADSDKPTETALIDAKPVDDAATR